MPRFRSKAEVDAYQWDGTLEGAEEIRRVLNAIEVAVHLYDGDILLEVRGTRVAPEEWVVLVGGAMQMHTDATFRATYKPVGTPDTLDGYRTHQALPGTRITEAIKALWESFTAEQQPQRLLFNGVDIRVQASDD